MWGFTGLFLSYHATEKSCIICLLLQSISKVWKSIEYLVGNALFREKLKTDLVFDLNHDLGIWPSFTLEVTVKAMVKVTIGKNTGTFVFNFLRNNAFPMSYLIVSIRLKHLVYYIFFKNYLFFSEINILFY